MTFAEQLGKIEKEALSIIEKYGKNVDVSCLNLEHQYVSGYYDDIEKIVDYNTVRMNNAPVCKVEELDVYNIVLLADYLNKINNENI